MAWQKPKIESFGDLLRFAVWACMVVNGILAAVFSVYFTARFLWHLKAWCERAIFSQSW